MNTSRTKSSSRSERSRWDEDDSTVTDKFHRQVRWFYRLLVLYFVWLGFLIYVALH